MFYSILSFFREDWLYFYCNTPYRSIWSGQTTHELGNFKATQGQWYGELVKSIPEGIWYFTVVNNGSHNVQVDSVTLNKY